ncbi:MAG: hypothetical protein PWQ57_2602 [Desulfovibrionales bacterium]|nr:hypothetical protein [Desulfovibrionales bacterium]
MDIIFLLWALSISSVLIMALMLEIHFHGIVATQQIQIMKGIANDK